MGLAFGLAPFLFRSKMGYIYDPDKAVALIKGLQGEIDGDFRLEMHKGPFNLKFALLDGPRDAASFELYEMPNCCGILVSTKTFVSPNRRRQGLAQELMALKLRIAKEFGYSMLTATVVVGRQDGKDDDQRLSEIKAQLHILNKTGWIRVQTFLNKRTNNLVGFFTKFVD